MKFAHDATVDALYVTLNDDGAVARTVEIDGSTMVDLDADGNLLGIEVLSPGSAWPLAEILSRWDVAPADASLLMQCYPNAFRVEVA